ncbi:MAG: TIGR00282 family metallophosphoesterase [Ruminococcaceae bacterium]|nr:TIGR00282 family metallophosphoesterase [Oscillospiraceae bacterium]
MKILAIGDIVSQVGRKTVEEMLDSLSSKVDFVIANAENAAHGKGLTKPIYEELCRYGVDGITLGNHCWGCPDIANVLRHQKNIIRPANFEGNCPGCGSMLLTAKNGVSVGVINLIGRTYMKPAASPFFAADKLVDALSKKTKIILVDFHAEATSEKIAMAHYLDGRVSAVFGTHTHVQTADEMIFPKGCGYITDLGMCGAVHSVLGMEKKNVIQSFLDGMPQRFEVANGRGQFCGCIFEIDEETGKCVGVERIFDRK